MKTFFLAAILAAGTSDQIQVQAQPFDVEAYAQVVTCTVPEAKKVCADLDGNVFHFVSPVDYRQGETIKLGLRLVQEGEAYRLFGHQGPSSYGI